MDSPLMPSELCEQWKEQALERGDTDSAMDYFNLKEMWLGRGM